MGNPNSHLSCVDYTWDGYSISPNLFEEEMKYLFENEFTIFQMKDVAYDDRELHIKWY